MTEASDETAPLTYGTTKSSLSNSKKSEHVGEQQENCDTSTTGFCHREFEQHGEEEDGEAASGTLELFSDLVIVVAIHIVAEPMEEVPDDDDDASSVVTAWYVVRVLLLFHVWLTHTFFMNSAAVFRRGTCPLHYTVVFVWMGLVLHMTQNFATGRDGTALAVYLVTRALDVLGYARQVGEDCADLLERDIVTAEQVNNMRSFVPIQVSTFFFCESIPFLVAVWLQDEQHTPYLPAIVCSAILFLGAYIWSALLSDRRRSGKPMADALDADHLNERFELITLIFIGEICFAAGKPAGNVVQFLVTEAALWTAFSAYLLIFTTRHKSRIEFWTRSAKLMVCGLVLSAGLFCAIPLLGASYARIINVEEEEEEEEEEGHLVDQVSVTVETGSTCHAERGTMLCYATTAFLILSSMLNLLDWDTSKRELKRLGLMGRFAVRVSCGIAALLWTLPAVMDSAAGCLGPLPSATFVCPALAISSAMLEVWAVGTMKWSKNSNFTFSFSVTN